MAAKSEPHDMQQSNWKGHLHQSQREYNKYNIWYDSSALNAQADNDIIQKL